MASVAENDPEQRILCSKREEGDLEEWNLKPFLLLDTDNNDNNNQKMTSMDSMAVRLAAIQSISGQLLPSKIIFGERERERE